MNGTTYRKLTEAQITTLESNGCRAADWTMVEAVEAFLPDNIRHCRFSGRIRIGKNVRIERIYESIENYEIGDDVVILNTESLVCNPGSTFGNGTRVSVLIESGGREVTIYNGLSAPIAYLSAMYRNRPEVAEHIEKLIGLEIQNKNPELGQIGPGTYIAHCGSLTDICTGENTILKGAAELTNGTVNSTADAPTTIGRGVIARDFIVADSSEVTDYAQLENCYVGQGCRIGKGFTAENSLFFANCECFQGEACSVFAGPFTVTHHKSTLLIGGMFSFYNAGSNSNQSNHMYRLGPIHQGILERGCKTSSGSYILFPAHIGAFSIVKGRHYHHPDTSLFPYSYLLEDNGKTILLPGANFKSAGVGRDEKKWPLRDRRRGSKQDSIIFDTLNPYLVEKVTQALELLDEMDSTNDHAYQGTIIPARQIERARETYRTLLDLYLAQTVIENGEALKPMRPDFPAGHWSDLCGLTIPQGEIDSLLKILPTFHSIHELQAALTGLYRHYNDFNLQYATHILETKFSRPINSFQKTDWQSIIRNGITAMQTVLAWRKKDTRKESENPMQAGYNPGTTANPDRSQEFEAIHGKTLQAGLEILEKEAETFMEKARNTLLKFQQI